MRKNAIMIPSLTKNVQITHRFIFFALNETTPIALNYDRIISHSQKPSSVIPSPYRSLKC
jgi:hypothetical protein